MANVMKTISGAVPHEGYHALLALTKHWNIKQYFVITSNADGMFEQAGFDEKRIWEIHGNLRHFQCEHDKVYKVDTDFEIDFDKDTLRAEPPYPECWCKDRQG